MTLPATAEARSQDPAPPSTTAFVGSIPAIYDRYLGPLLFEFSAADLAARLADRFERPINVLEIACGTGISTEHLWRALPRGSQLLATDLNPAMLQYATSQRGCLSNVTYRLADALALPFDDTSFDAVVCQFGLMFFPDKARGIAEMTRVLSPGGVLLTNVWDSLEENPVVDIAHRTIGSFFPGDPPRFLETPFGYHDTDLIEGLLRDAGLADVSFERVAARVEHPAASVARGLVEGTPGVLDIEARAGVDSATVVQAVHDAIERAYGSPKPRFELQEIVFTAEKPR